MKHIIRKTTSPRAMLASFTLVIAGIFSAYAAPWDLPPGTPPDPESFWLSPLHWTDMTDDYITLAWDAPPFETIFFELMRDWGWFGYFDARPNTAVYAYTDLDFSPGRTSSYCFWTQNGPFNHDYILTSDFQTTPAWWSGIQLEIAGGNAQVARPNDFLGKPLVVQVHGKNIENMPVTFSAVQGSGTFHKHEGTESLSLITLLADSEGKVRVWFRQPQQNAMSITIRATCAGKQVFFTTFSDNTYEPVPGGAEIEDSDGDGMPDSWEIAHGLNPNDPSDASLDNDNDGFTNLEEYINGQNPNVPDTPDLKLEIFSPTL